MRRGNANGLFHRPHRPRRATLLAVPEQSDVALRELEEFLHQNQQDPGPNSGSDDPSDSA